MFEGGTECSGGGAESNGRREDDLTRRAVGKVFGDVATDLFIDSCLAPLAPGLVPLARTIVVATDVKEVVDLGRAIDSGFDGPSKAGYVELENQQTLRQAELNQAENRRNTAEFIEFMRRCADVPTKKEPDSDKYLPRGRSLGDAPWEELDVDPDLPCGRSLG